MRPGHGCFTWGEIQRRVQDVFDILLTAEDNVQIFGEQLKISCISAVPQSRCCPRIILNLSSQLDKETLSVNNTTDRDIAPYSMHFG